MGWAIKKFSLVENNAALRKTTKDAGLADAIVLAHSKEINAKLLTGDKHLKNLEKSTQIRRFYGR